ncbi:MAG: response regulator [Bryobacteraceae bacterium]
MTQDRQPYRLLLIEDNPADTGLLRYALDEQNEPYVLEELPDGETALRYVREHCGRNAPEPCLIILDLHLPRCDGLTVLEAIRSEPELSHVAVAVVTSSASPIEKAEVLALGVRLYRQKPISYDEMVELARELIEICREPLKVSIANE